MARLQAMTLEGAQREKQRKKAGPPAQDLRQARTPPGAGGEGRSAPAGDLGAGRNLTLHVQENEIVEVTSPHDNPVTHGNLCVKARFGYRHAQQH